MENKLHLIQPYLWTGLHGLLTDSKEISHPGHMYIYEFKAPDRRTGVTMRFIPSPYIEWIICYNEKNSHSCFYCIGASTKGFEVKLSHYDRYFAVRFDDDLCYLNPEAVAHAKPADLANQVFSYTPEKDSAEHALISQLMAAPSFQQHVHDFLAFLKKSKALCTPSPALKSIRDGIRAQNRVTIADIAHALNYTPRHVSRIFNSYYGFNAKDYRSYLRFQHVLNSMIQNPQQLNADYIAGLSYTDQSHFQREFHTFMQISPHLYVNALKSL